MEAMYLTGILFTFCHVIIVEDVPETDARWWFALISALLFPLYWLGAVARWLGR